VLHVSSMRESDSTQLRADLHHHVYASLNDRLASRKPAPGEKHQLPGARQSPPCLAQSGAAGAHPARPSEGLVEVKPHFGHVVKPLTVVPGYEAHDIREELWVADQTVGRITRGDPTELRRPMERTLPMVDPGPLESGSSR
jgi:DNA-binding GntR family transcriptional regulator